MALSCVKVRRFYQSYRMFSILLLMGVFALVAHFGLRKLSRPRDMRAIEDDTIENQPWQPDVTPSRHEDYTLPFNLELSMPAEFLNNPLLKDTPKCIRQYGFDLDARSVVSSVVARACARTRGSLGLRPWRFHFTSRTCAIYVCLASKSRLTQARAPYIETRVYENCARVGCLTTQQPRAS